MGFMDKFSKIIGGDKPTPADTVKGPSAILREHGIDPSNLKFSFNQDGSVSVAGHVQDQAECERICQLIKEMPNVCGVKNNLVVGTAQATAKPEPEPAVVEAETTETATAATGAADRGMTYTVQSGDTLWVIAAKVYGSGGKYMKIFEANKGVLDNPDKIFPGQELVIPDLEEK